MVSFCISVVDLHDANKYITKLIQKTIPKELSDSNIEYFLKFFFPPCSMNVNLGQRPKVHLLMELKLLNVNYFSKRGS